MTLIKNIKLGTPVTTGVKLLGTKADGATGNFSIDDIKTYLESGVSLSYTLPESIGTAGQVLQVPAAGTELEWSDATISLTTIGNSGVATLVSGTLNIPEYQRNISVTSTGTSGAATLTDGTLNIPQYKSVGGSDTQMQYNNSGDLAGISTFSYNSGTNTLTFGNSTFNLTTGHFTFVSADGNVSGIYGNASVNGYSPVLNIAEPEFTLRLEDGSNTIVFTNTSPCTLYVDADSITNFPIGTEIKVINSASSTAASIDCGSTATINGQNNTIAETISKYETGVLKKIGNNKWVFGKIA
jgi:hypothetical protein